MKQVFKLNTDTTSLNALLNKSWPSIFEVSGKPVLFSQLLMQWSDSHPEVVIYSLDGSCMRTVDQYESEIIRVFNLPDYYGRNLNALYECLTDEDVLGEGAEAILIVVSNADQILSSTPNDILMRNGFFDILELAGMDWCIERPMYNGGPARATRPFHTLLLTDNTRESYCPNISISLVSDVRVMGLTDICPDNIANNSAAIVCCLDIDTKETYDNAEAMICQQFLNAWHALYPKYSIRFLFSTIYGKLFPVVLPPSQINATIDPSICRMIIEPNRKLPSSELIKKVISLDGLLLGFVHDIIKEKLWFVVFVSYDLAITLYADLKNQLLNK